MFYERGLLMNTETTAAVDNGNGSSLIMVQGSGGVPMGVAIP